MKVTRGEAIAFLVGFAMCLVVIWGANTTFRLKTIETKHDGLVSALVNQQRSQPGSPPATPGPTQQQPQAGP